MLLMGIGVWDWGDLGIGVGIGVGPEQIDMAHRLILFGRAPESLSGKIRGCFRDSNANGRSIGPGYRIYFGKEAVAVILLLLGGDKSSQASDIRDARKLWKDYLETKHHGKAQ